VTSENVLAERFGIELLGLDIVAGKARLGVWDVETTIGSTLQRTEDTSTGRGPNETDIKEGLEWTAALITLGGLGESELTVSLLNTDEVLVKVELFERATSNKETSGVGSGPVCETVGDAVAFELVGVGGSKDAVTVQLGADNLALEWC
jgi:hypothetical protein